MMLFNQATMPATATVEGYDSPPASFAVNQQQQPQLQQQQQQQQRLRRKRKADLQDANNERLSKRMSLLNLERNGPKLYVPVEQPQLRPPPTQPSHDATTTSNSGIPPFSGPAIAEEPMHLDDTAHKVYIYNLDDELSSENESDPEDREGKLVFLPDIEKHLRANRIPVPRPILPNKDGELAGMQLVLYSDGPSSISVPKEQDSVRKAIIEARARVRQRQAEERDAGNVAAARSNAGRTEKVSFATPVRFSPQRRASADMMLDPTAGQSSASSVVPGSADVDYDPDAMDID